MAEQQDTTDAGQSAAPQTAEQTGSILDDAPESKPEGEEGTKTKTDDTAEGAEGSEGANSDEDAGDGGEIEYKDFTLPEGMEVDEVGMTSFKTEIKAFNDGEGLTQEDGQKLIDMHTKVMGEALTAQQQQWTDVTNGWVDEIKADTEYGGAKFQQTQSEMLLAAQEYGSPELVDILKKEPAFANRPAFVKFMTNVGRTLTEDQHQRGEPSKPKKDVSERLYPNQ